MAPCQYRPLLFSNWLPTSNFIETPAYFSNDRPDKLQEFVWFNLCYYLGQRGREGWRELTKNSLEFKHNDQDKEYVTIKHTKQNKNNQGGSKQKDQDYTDVRMYGLLGLLMDLISSLKIDAQ